MRSLVVALALALTISIAEAEAPERPRWEPVPPPRSAAPAGVEERDIIDIVLFEATGYSHACGNGDGVTATGTVPRPGVISVDPKVIPLGTLLYVEGYGYGRAEDTGGVIKGDKLDLFFETEEEAIRWGRQLVRVEVIP